MQNTGIDPNAISNDYHSKGAFGSKKLLSMTGSQTLFTTYMPTFIQ
tara:strand:+ start:811 stop:948 length:138 start_codon:yes stop_codon:yes gene_type:complete